LKLLLTTRERAITAKDKHKPIKAPICAKPIENGEQATRPIRNPATVVDTTPKNSTTKVFAFIVVTARKATNNKTTKTSATTIL